MSFIYINEATYQYSDLYLHGKLYNSWVLQSVIQVSSLESKRTLVVPERSLGGFWHNGCPNDTFRKLYINFHISTCLGIAPSPKCLQRVIMESKRMLVVPERSLDGFDIMDDFNIHQWSYISIFRPLPSWKVVQLLGSPERHLSVILGV